MFESVQSNIGKRGLVETVGTVGKDDQYLCSYWSYCFYQSSVPTGPVVPTDPLSLLILCSYCSYWSYCSFWSSIPTDPTKILPILCFYHPLFLLFLCSYWSSFPADPTDPVFLLCTLILSISLTSVRSSYTSREPIWAYGLNWVWVAHVGISTEERLGFKGRTFHVLNLMHQ